MTWKVSNENGKMGWGETATDPLHPGNMSVASLSVPLLQTTCSIICFLPIFPNNGSMSGC